MSLNWKPATGSVGPNSRCQTALSGAVSAVPIGIRPTVVPPMSSANFCCAIVAGQSSHSGKLSSCCSATVSGVRRGDATIDTRHWPRCSLSPDSRPCGKTVQMIFCCAMEGLRGSRANEVQANASQ